MNTDSNSTGGDQGETSPEFPRTSSAPTLATTEGRAGTPRDVASIVAFVLALLGAILLAIPLAVLGVLRTRAGARRGRGFALAAFAVSAAWMVAGVAFVSSGLLGTGGPLAASTLAEPTDSPVVVFPTPSPTASTSSPTPPQKPLAKARKVNWRNLKPGMCVEDAADAATKIPVVDCRAPHQLEVTARTKASGPSRWPGDDKMLELVERPCRTAFERYVGVDYDQSDLELDFWTPDEEGWSNGARTLVCFVYDPLSESTTEAFAETAR